MVGLRVTVFFPSSRMRTSSVVVLEIAVPKASECLDGVGSGRVIVGRLWSHGSELAEYTSAAQTKPKYGLQSAGQVYRGQVLSARFA